MPQILTEQSGGPLVTLSLSLMRRYDLGEGGLASTAVRSIISSKIILQAVNARKPLDKVRLEAFREKCLRRKQLRAQEIVLRCAPSGACCATPQFEPKCRAKAKARYNHLTPRIYVKYARSTALYRNLRVVRVSV